MNKCQGKGKLMGYDIIKDYLEHGDNFNLTGEERDPFYIYEISDDDLIREYDIICTTEKLHWKEEWEFIFRHEIIKRRKRKINKILKNE